MTQDSLMTRIPTTHMQTARGHTTQTIDTALPGVALPPIAPASVAAIGLAIAAVVGRATTFIVDGPTPPSQVVAILLVAIAVLVFAREASLRGAVGPIEEKLLKMARRVGVVQVAFSMWLIVVAGWIS